MLILCYDIILGLHIYSIEILDNNFIILEIILKTNGIKIQSSNK